MDDLNKKALNTFGRENRGMGLDSPNRSVDNKMGCLMSHLDAHLVRRWVLPALTPDRRKDLSILDVGAGKGRMTRYFITVAADCVALEPFPEFYQVLKSRFEASNLETYPLRLAEYAGSTTRRFDLVYASGVTTYLSDGEMLDFLTAARGLLRQGGMVILRDIARNPEPTEFARTPKEIEQFALKAGLSLKRVRRAYPICPPWILWRALPNRITALIWNFAGHKAFYPLWRLVAALNLLPQRSHFLVYLLRIEDKAK